MRLSWPLSPNRSLVKRRQPSRKNHQVRQSPTLPPWSPRLRPRQQRRIPPLPGRITSRKPSPKRNPKSRESRCRRASAADSRTPQVALVVSPGRHLGAGRHCRYFLILVLQLVELVVDAALGEKLLVRAHFAHLSLVHNDDLVGPLNRR